MQALIRPPRPSARSPSQATTYASDRVNQVEGVTEAGLRTPKAAAIAGVVFSLLTLASFGLLWRAIPAEPRASGAWVATNANEVTLALNLIPFAGIAFLWFIGVIRDRLGRREDRFFATVFSAAAYCFSGCCSSLRPSSGPC